MSDYLEQFESFDEFEDKPLYVDSKSDIFLVIYNKKKYIAWEKIDFARTVKYKDENYLEMQKSFYNVIDGSFILNTYELYDLDINKIKSTRPDDVLIYPLSEKLGLDFSESMVLSREKVLTLTRNSN